MYSTKIKELTGSDMREIAKQIVEIANIRNSDKGQHVYWDKKKKRFVLGSPYCRETLYIDSQKNRYILLGVYNWLADWRHIYEDIMTLKSELEPSIPSQLRNLADISRRVANEANG